MILNSLCC